MALWEYEIEFPDGRRESRVVAAGNQAAAATRALEFSARIGARVVGDVRAVDRTRGSM